MMIAARNAFLMSGAKLPYDAEVEYLRTDGNEYILVGVSPQSDIRIAGAFRWNQIVGQARFFSSNLAGAEFSLYRGGNLITSRGGSTERQVTFDGGTNGNIYAFDYSLDKVSLNGTTKTFGIKAPSGNNLQFAIFGRNNSGTVLYSDYKMLCDFYWCKFYINNNLVRDFIPVRVGSGSSAVGYLYDRANPTGGPLGNGLYPNAGTGAFVTGPDK